MRPVKSDTDTDPQCRNSPRHSESNGASSFGCRHAKCAETNSPPSVPASQPAETDPSEDRLQHALTLLQRGLLYDAGALCAALLQQNPQHAGALHLSGVIAMRNGDPTRALAWLERAVSLRPDCVAALRDLGSALFAANQPAEALRMFEQAIALAPDDAEAHYNRATALSHLGRYVDALASYDVAIARRPEQAVLHNGRAATLWRLRRHDEALAGCAQAIALLPAYAEAHFNRATMLATLGHYEAALASYDAAVALQPDQAIVLNGRGATLCQMQRYQAALVDYERAIALAPAYVEAHANRALTLLRLRHYGDALAAYDRTIALSAEAAQRDPAQAPRHARSLWEQSLCLLQRGDYTRGWQQYEWRKRLDEPMGKRDFVHPEWLGQQPIAGRTLFIHSEQGLGDAIQFCRYARLAAARGARVVLAVYKPLQRLLRTLGPDITIIGADDVPPTVDLHCPMLSLPLAFGTTLTTIPAAMPYLAADPVAVTIWQARLATLPGIRVGLCWAGAPRPENPVAHATDQRRSITLAQYAPLAAVRGVSFVSLQKGAAAAQAATPPAGLSLHDWTAELHDFADTAALIAALDLVITVDTAVAHAAGALGKPVWILNRYDNCWRWLTDGSDSPWYPSARLWRQPAPGDWDSVIDGVTTALRAWVGA